jgi:hypothetical protein
MLFNPADKSNSLIADIDFWLFGNSDTFNTDYSLTDRTRQINVVWDEVVAELYKADPNYKWDDTTNSDLPIATIDLTANQDHYSLLDTALVIHRVRIKDTEGNYVTLTPRLRSELTDTDLASTGTADSYYKLGGAIFPIPVPDYGATDGVELEFQRGGNHFVVSDTDESPGFNPQFHNILSIGASLNYAIANGLEKKINQLRAEKERIRGQIQDHYNRRSPDERPQLRLKPGNIRRFGF